jgi:hypothetical protein
MSAGRIRISTDSHPGRCRGAALAAALALAGSATALFGGEGTPLAAGVCSTLLPAKPMVQERSLPSFASGLHFPGYPKTDESAQIIGEVKGVITSPVLDVYNPVLNQEFKFTLSGSANVSPGGWFLAIDVLKDADADPIDEFNWVYNVLTFRTQGTGPEIFKFSDDAIAPFQKLANAWKPGGLGRFRLVAALYSDPSYWAILPVCDSQGKLPFNAYTIVVADASPDPTQNEVPPKYLSANRKMPPVIFDPTKRAEQEQLTNDYYNLIKTDQNGTGRSIRQEIGTLDKFISHYFGPANSSCIINEPATMARYFNKGDLGIGREMHCVINGCTSEAACYVKNFGSPDGTAKFDDIPAAKQALLADNPFATVAMVARTRMRAEDPNRVFFVVYQNNGELLTSAKLDNTGFNTQIPGNCLQCHGINSGYSVGAAHLVRNAFFLPFDIDAFEFFSKDANNPLSRAKQLYEFRILNRIVLKTIPVLKDTPLIIDLINGWYGGDLYYGKFDGGFIPKGWQDGSLEAPIESQKQLYRKVVKIGCRGCHVSYLSREVDDRPYLKFGTFTDFTRLAEKDPQKGPSVQKYVCQHIMPAAEQTLKVLWRSSGRVHLFSQIPGLPVRDDSNDCHP